MKICHLHLKNGFGIKQTLICSLYNGSINYLYYGGWSSSGLGQSLSNLRCTLPVEKLHDGETKEEFIQRVVDIINEKSVCTVIKKIDTNVRF
jgi:hypothetical protein